MKKLIKWLERQEEGKQSMAWLARQIGVNGAYLSRAVNDVQPLGIWACESIHRLTDGEVSLKHLNPKLYKKYMGCKCLKEG